MKTLIITILLMLTAIPVLANGNGKSTAYHKRPPIELALGLGVQSANCPEVPCTGKCCGQDDGNGAQGFFAGRIGYPVSDNVKLEGEIAQIMSSNWDPWYRAGVWLSY
jgi:hypothetical protein